jgi:hypothetical protein
VFGPDGRPPARHAARSSIGRRRFMLAIAVLIALASVPSLAVVLAGAASLESTPGARSPYVADGPDGPVRVDPGGDARIREDGRPPVTVEPPRALPDPRATATGRRPSAPGRRATPIPEAGALGAAGPRAESCTASPPSSSGTPSTPTPGVVPTSSGASSSGPSSSGPVPGPTPERTAGSFGLDLGIIRIRFG